MKTKAYPKYKPSGVEWLGDVPEHWEVKKLKYVSETCTGFAFNSDDYTNDGIPLVRIGDILQNGSIDIDNAKKLPDEYLQRYRFVRVEKEDILMAMTGATIGKAGQYQFDEPGLLNQRVCKFVPNTINKKYLSFILKSESYIEHIKLTGFGGAQPNISDVQLLDFCSALPPLPEQQAIATFLDRQTGTIDTLIVRKQQLLEMLKEQRTAMISRAVTKGLNPKVKMKRSGVEWLGDVPEHWDVKKMRYIFSFRSGGTPSTENPLFWDGHIPWVSSKDMKTFFIEDTEDHITEDAVKESATSIMPTGSLLVVMRSGILIHSIPASVIKYDMAINQDIKAFLPKFTISSIYYARFIEGYQKQLLTEWRKEGATVESLDMELINNFQILFPPFPEQQAIAEYLDSETGKIDALASKVETAIEKLKEYRTALISAAVTGRIDVREAV